MNQSSSVLFIFSRIKLGIDDREDGVEREKGIMFKDSKAIISQSPSPSNWQALSHVLLVASTLYGKYKLAIKWVQSDLSAKKKNVNKTKIIKKFGTTFGFQFFLERSEWDEKSRTLRQSERERERERNRIRERETEWERERETEWDRDRKTERERDRERERESKKSPQ